MDATSDYALEISVATQFLDDESDPDAERYVFAYTIRIRNLGRLPAQLINRHWVITDANGKIEEVRGEGVVGEQPLVHPGEGYEYTSGAVLETEPGEQFTYTSGAILATSVGTMEGSYDMSGDDGTQFDAPIPPFTLSVPRTLH